ncbi:MAG: hypothetical protein HYY49_01225 [Ignavibacteriales bacterium]|nr:hypothetical protein [Ignavibacteriales bacterium]
MKIWLSQFWRLTFITFMGLLGSVTLGLMRYGGSVLDPSEIAFAYVAFGLSGSFIFAFYHVRGLSNTITAAVSVSALQFVASVSYIPVLNSAIWSFGVNLSVVALAFLFERRLASFKQLKFIIVGLVYGSLFVLLTLLVAMLTKVASMPAEVFHENFVDGLLIGLGLGVGAEVAESFIHSIEQRH